MSKDAVKHDEEKPRLDLLSSAALIEIAKVMTFGAKKYDDHNWRKGFKWSRLTAALQRHMLAFNDGEDIDPETGLPHLAHAGCCIMFLLEHQVKDLGEDDRYKSKGAEDVFKLTTDIDDTVTKIVDYHNSIDMQCGVGLEKHSKT